MSDLVARLKLANSEFNSAAEQSKQKIRELQDTADDAGKTIDKMGDKGAKSASDMLKEMGKIENGARSVSDYRRQLMQLQKQIVDLTVNYRSMSAEMQNSAKGMEIKALLDEATQHASILKDAIGDVTQEIKNMASDTAIWDGMKMGIDTVSSSLQAFVSAGVLGEKSTKQLVEVLAKLKGIEAATNAVIKIGNALQRNSALMTSIAAIQSKALAAAKNMEAAATAKATIAQKAFNIVAKANPYVLIAAALIAVGTALFAFTKKTKEAEEAEQKHQEQLEKEQEAIEEWKNTVGSAAGSALAKFDRLSKEYGKLSSKLEKTNWIKANAEAFKELGLSITDLGTADSVFINNTDAFKSAIMERARAAAMYNIIVKNFENYAKKLEEINKKAAPFQAGQVMSEQQARMTGHQNDYWTLGQSDRHMGTPYVTLSEAGAEVLNAEWREKQRKQVEQELNALNGDLEKEIADANAKFNAILSMYGVKPSGGSGGNTVQINYEVGSLAEAQAKVQELQTALNNMSPDNPKFEETKTNLEAAKKEVERIKKLLETAKPSAELNLVPNSLQEATHFVQVFQQQLQELDPATDEFQEVLELLNIWKKRQQEINDLISGTTQEVETVANKYRKIASKRDEIQFNFNIGAIDEATARQQIEELNKQLEGMGLKANLKLELDKESVKTVGDEIRSFVDSMNTVGSISNGVNAINSVYEAISQLGEKMSEAKNGWEQFMLVFQLGMTIFNATAQIIEVIATVTDLLSAAKAKNAAATTAETSATVADTAASTANAGAKITEAAASGAAAAAGGASAVASIPYVGPVLAIAAIASIMAAIIGIIASAKGFANGGIVDAASKYGDKNLVRVNGGEMILNQKQQDNLFKMIDEGRQDKSSNTGGQVEFKIKGTELVGVLNNQNRKNSKI